jgi:hypothetical protein
VHFYNPYSKLVVSFTQQREKTWFASSMKTRSQYLGEPWPGVPVAEDDLNPSTGPVDAYCLLTLDPEKVSLGAWVSNLFLCCMLTFSYWCLHVR